MARDTANKAVVPPYTLHKEDRIRKTVRPQTSVLQMDTYR